MVKFIAERIINAHDNSSLEGRNKYCAYFVDTFLYLEYKFDVDNILQQEGYSDCLIG